MTEDKHMNMYGCDTADLDTMISEAIITKTFTGTPINKERDLSMLAMSILSDAQHVMEHGDTDKARQFINRAKYVIMQGEKE